MSVSRHVFEIYIRADADAVWRALTDPEFTSQYFYGSSFVGELTAGSNYRYDTPTGPAIEGVIEEVDPGSRLVMSFRFSGAEFAAEPASRVEWDVTPIDERITRLTLRHGDLFQSPLTWDRVRMGWLPVIDGLKTLLETGAPLGAIDDPAAAPAEDPEGEWHRSQAIEANNMTWDWLGKADDERTEDDAEQMTLSAYAAAYHWARAARRTPANAARANWLLSRVWVTRGEGALALHHADLVVAACLAAEIGDFDLAYGHEGRARALACLGRHAEARAERAMAAQVPIIDDEDRQIFEGDLVAEPWFGA